MSLAKRPLVVRQSLNSTNKPIRILKGHNKFITALGYDKANKKVYSGAYDANIVAWDVDTADTTTFSGKGHTNQINEIRVAGGNIITAGALMTLFVSMLLQLLLTHLIELVLMVLLTPSQLMKTVILQSQLPITALF